MDAHRRRPDVRLENTVAVPVGPERHVFLRTCAAQIAGVPAGPLHVDDRPEGVGRGVEANARELLEGRVSSALGQFLDDSRQVDAELARLGQVGLAGRGRSGRGDARVAADHWVDGGVDKPVVGNLGALVRLEQRAPRHRAGRAGRLDLRQLGSPDARLGEESQLGRW